MAASERQSTAVELEDRVARIQAELAAKEREALEVIKEDLCHWLADVLQLKISGVTFLETLDTGIALCRLAALVQQSARAAREDASVINVPMETVNCNIKAEKGSFFARDNTSNFITWCRKLGVEEAVIFESEGLVLHRDEKRVILSLLDVARYAERVGISPPQLVRMEKEIEALETQGYRDLSSPPSSDPESEEAVSTEVLVVKRNRKLSSPPTTEATPTTGATPTTDAPPTTEATPTTDATPTTEATPTTDASMSDEHPVVKHSTEQHSLPSSAAMLSAEKQSVTTTESIRPPNGAELPPIEPRAPRKRTRAQRDEVAPQESDSMLNTSERDEEVGTETHSHRPKKRKREKSRTTKETKREESVEDKVMKKLNECSCKEKLKSQRCGHGKFIIQPSTRDKKTTLYARLLSDRVMVRVGGGWDTLDHFLLKHDPCRMHTIAALRRPSQAQQEGTVIGAAATLRKH